MAELDPRLVQHLIDAGDRLDEVVRTQATELSQQAVLTRELMIRAGHLESQVESLMERVLELESRQRQDAPVEEHGLIALETARAKGRAELVRAVGKVFTATGAGGGIVAVVWHLIQTFMHR